MKTCKRKKSYPSWAKYKATDKQGRVYIYKSCPYPFESLGIWLLDNWIDTGFIHIKTKKTPPKDWMKTLRRIED